MNTFRLAATSGCAYPRACSLISSERQLSRSGQPVRSRTKKVLRFEVFVLAQRSSPLPCRSLKAAAPITPPIQSFAQRLTRARQEW